MKPLAALSPGECAFPIGSGAAVRFCAAEAVPGRSYCPACHRRAYIPGSEMTSVELRSLQALFRRAA